jgi:small-conductance mechanosensitive channel
VTAMVILVGLLLIFWIIGSTSIVSDLLRVTDILAFIIEFALKDIGENFLSGILLAFKAPFEVGEIFDVSGIHGQVFNLHGNQIKTLDGNDIFIPNQELIKNPLINFTIDGYLR